MNSRERRIDTRINLNVPLRFRVLNIPNSQELTGESINISQRGILFATAIPLLIGTPLEVSLKMPREVAGHCGGASKGWARAGAFATHARAWERDGDESAIHEEQETRRDSM